MADPDLFAEAASRVADILRPLSVDPEDVETKLKFISIEIQKMDIDPSQQRARRKVRLKLYRDYLAALQKCVDVLDQAAPAPLWDLERLLSNEIGELFSNQAFRQNGIPVFPSSGARYFEGFTRYRDPAARMAEDFDAQTRSQRRELARRYGAGTMLLVLRRLQAPLREQIDTEVAKAPDGRPIDQRRRFVFWEIWDVYRQLTGESLPKVPPERFRAVCSVTLHLYGVDEVGFDKAADRLFAQAHKRRLIRENSGKT